MQRVAALLLGGENSLEEVYLWQIGDDKIRSPARGDTSPAWGTVAIKEARGLWMKASKPHRGRSLLAL
jgi:hypothetical protein